MTKAFLLLPMRKGATQCDAMKSCQYSPDGKSYMVIALAGLNILCEQDQGVDMNIFSLRILFWTLNVQRDLAIIISLTWTYPCIKAWRVSFVYSLCHSLKEEKGLFAAKPSPWQHQICRIFLPIEPHVFSINFQRFGCINCLQKAFQLLWFLCSYFCCSSQVSDNELFECFVNPWYVSYNPIPLSNPF